MNDTSLHLKKPHLNTIIFKNYIVYIQKHHPNINLEELVKSCGLDLEYLKSSSHWVSTVFDRDFTVSCIKATKDVDLCTRVSAFAMSKEGMPAPIYLAVKLLTSVEFLYKMLNAKIIPGANKVVSVRVKSESSGNIEVEMVPILAGLNAEDAQALIENFPNIVQSTIGYYSAFPKLLNAPPAKIAFQIAVDHYGIPYCSMKIQYTNHRAFVVLILYAASFALSFFSVMQLVTYMPPFHAIIFSLLPIIFAYSIRSKIRMRGLEEVSTDAQKSYTALQSQYAETFAAKSALARSLNEQDVINSLLRILIQARTTSDVIESGCNFLVEKFGFDRVVVLHLNESKDQLIYRYGSSTHAESLKFFSNLKLPTVIDSDDPSKLTNVYRFKKSLLIEDCNEHIKTLSEEGKLFLRASQSLSFIAVPIVASETCFGLFVIDAFQERRKLTLNDLHLAEKVANAVAAALEKNSLQAEREAALERSNRFKDQILANTSHELRTPINGIVNLARIVRDSAQSRLLAQESEFLISIEQSGNRLSRLVNNIIDQSKINYGKLHLLIEPVSLATKLFEVTSELQAALNLKAIHIEITERAKNHWILADKDKVFQILMNLIQNAVKFTQKGKITIDAERVQENLVISVSDSGPGVPTEFREQIFEPFVKAGNSTRADGAGLGLSITKALVTQMHGRIWVEPAEQASGACFKFTLPAAKSPESESHKGVSQNLQLPEEARVNITDHEPHTLESKNLENSVARFPERHELRPIQIANELQTTDMKEFKETTILIVDDEEINVTVLRHFLVEAQFKVESAPCGEAALSMIAQGMNPELVLLDIMMPGLSGYEVCSKLRQTHPAISLPILMMSAKQEVEDVLKGFEAGANDYITKPFVKEILLARVVSQLGVSYMSRIASRFVPWELVHLLGAKDLTEVTLGKGQEVELAIFYLDLRKFTELLESMQCSDAFHFLNSFLGHVVPIIIKHHGIVDKYIGDCVMGVFMSANDAVQAAIEVQDSMKAYNLRHRSGGKRRFVHAGIGIHWGKAYVGSIGIAKRLEITVISDAVNLGSRLQNLTKTYGVEILVSQELVDQFSVNGESPFRYIDHVMIRGRQEKVQIYSVGSAESTGSSEEKLAS